MAGEERGEGILGICDRTGERPREGATLGTRVDEGGGSGGMVGDKVGGQWWSKVEVTISAWLRAVVK
jgi:hypothetical protein